MIDLETRMIALARNLTLKGLTPDEIRDQLSAKYPDAEGVILTMNIENDEMPDPVETTTVDTFNEVLLDALNSEPVAFDTAGVEMGTVDTEDTEAEWFAGGVSQHGVSQHGDEQESTDSEDVTVETETEADWFAEDDLKNFERAKLAALELTNDYKRELIAELKIMLKPVKTAKTPVVRIPREKKLKEPREPKSKDPQALLRRALNGRAGYSKARQMIILAGSDENRTLEMQTDLLVAQGLEFGLAKKYAKEMIFQYANAIYPFDVIRTPEQFEELFSSTTPE